MKKDPNLFWEGVCNTATAELLAYFPDSTPDIQAAERVFALLKAHAPRSAFNPEDVAAWKRELEKYSQPQKRPNLLQRIKRRLEIR